MDHRIALPVGQELQFPGMKCVIEGEVGRGSNAIVYRGWYEDATDVKQHHPVLLKELFPFYERGAIIRDEKSGEIQCLPEGAEIMALHQKSFRWGNDIHLKMKAKHPEETGGNINTFSCNGTYYTLLDYSGGRTLESEYFLPNKPLSLRRIVLRCLGVLDALDVFHDMGFLHLDISPDNVILLNHGRRERVELIDYNSVVPVSTLTQDSALHLSKKQGYASPEVRKGDLRNIGTWTDLYSVTALFYFCLMGIPLSRMQLGGISPVHVKESKWLKDAPSTVMVQIQKILVKGLAASTKRRYQTVAEMLSDFQELLDRIDGIGITHWALWESCANNLRREIGDNTSLAYLTDEFALYPLELSDSQGNPIPGLLKKETSAVLTGSGGMGKTTVFLRTAWLESQRYRADCPVVCYLSLGNYSPGDGNYIHDNLLRKMRFPRDTLTYETARHTLNLLLQKPIPTKQGPRPVVYLLLDGYNEIIGDTKALHNEIIQLAQMDGVVILISSRTALPEYKFETWRMESLKERTIADVLGRNGLLIPEESQVRELLHNPMMLNLFVCACLNEESQLTVTDGQSLINAYLKAIIGKALRSVPSDSIEGWQIQTAVECVLPVIAGVSAGQHCSNGLLVKHISQIYSLLDSSLIKKSYPKWVGHIGSIRGDCKDAEEWYRLVVQEILWRRLGLLVRDSEGQYRIFHQEFQEALAAEGKALMTSISRRKVVWLAALGCAVLVGICTLFAMTSSTPIPSYEPKQAIDMMSHIQMLSVSMDDQQEILTGLLDNQTPTENRFDGDTYNTLPGFSRALEQLAVPSFVVLVDHVPDGEKTGDGNLLQEYQDRMAKLTQTGQQLPWNQLPIDAEDLKDGVLWFHETQMRYLGYVEVLETVYEQEPEKYNHCCQLIRNIVEADTQVCAAYYLTLYDKYMAGLEEWERKPAWLDFQGTAKRMADNLTIRPELWESIQMLNRMSQNEVRNIISQAEKGNRECQRLLARDSTYAKYAFSLR